MSVLAQILWESRCCVLLVLLLEIALPQLLVHMCVVISKGFELAAFDNIVVVGLGASASHIQLWISLTLSIEATCLFLLCRLGSTAT